MGNCSIRLIFDVYPRGSKYLKNEYLAPTIILMILHLENLESSYCIVIWMVRDFTAA